MASTPQDGRMTSFAPVPATLAGTELMWLVQPGNPSLGVLYNATLDTLAAFFAAYPALNSELITAGATVASPYLVQALDTRILFDKTLASASYAVCPLASSMTYGQPVLFKDLKGDADTNNITITFTGSELCDGLSTVQITTAYGWVTLVPKPGGGAWYMS